MKTAIIQSLTDNFEYYAKKNRKWRNRRAMDWKLDFRKPMAIYFAKAKRTIELTFD